MITEKFYISNSEVKPPKNWKGLAIELNYGKDQFPNANTITITDFEWCRENYDSMQQTIADGLTGGNGIFEGLPFRIDITNGIITKTVFEGCIDLTTAIFTNKKGKLPGSDGTITAKAINYATVDWIYSIAGGFTYEYLASDTFKATGLPGYISPDMYVFTPYVNSKAPDYQQAALATLMAYEVGKAIKDAVKQIYDLCAEIIENWSDIEITEIIKILIEVAYLIALIATIVKLIEDIVKFIISPVKYHAGMRVRDLMAKGVEYISEGKMTFVSDIWIPGSPYYNEVITPEKLYSPITKTDTSLFGFLFPDKNEQIGYFKGTFAQLLDAMKIKYNAKIIVTSDNNGVGTVTLLRRDKNAQPPVYQLADYYFPEYKFNTDELISNYLIEYQTDGEDQNTLQYYRGTVCQIITQPKVFSSRQAVLMKNYNTASIPFARAIRKNSLTQPEKILNDTVDNINKILRELSKALSPLVKAYDKMQRAQRGIENLLGTFKPLKKAFDKAQTIYNNTNVQLALQIAGLNPGGNNPIALLLNDKIRVLASTPAISIAQREGMMLLSSDHFSVPKIYILQESPSGQQYNKIHIDNDTIESALAMWNGYHFVNSFIPNSARPTGNQYLIRTFTNVPFTWDDYLKVIANNRIFDANGNEAVLESLKFNPYTQSADMVIRFSYLYTINLQEQILEPTGE